MSLKLVAISDTHNHIIRDVPEGDIVIHSGDATNGGSIVEIAMFNKWFSSLPHRYKIFIAGNHDRLFETSSLQARSLLSSNIIYLENSGVEIEGIKIWGSPVTPAFCNWAFNVDRDSDRMKDICNLIPNDTEVLITHGPAYQVLDRCDDQDLGCKVLSDRISKLDNLKYHQFGHFHMSSGVQDCGRYKAVNAAICDDSHRLRNNIKVIDYV